MRYITIPEDITLVNPENGEVIKQTLAADSPDEPPWRMLKFLTRFVFIDEKMGNGRKGSKAVRRLTKVFKDAKDGDVVEVESEDWEAMRRVIEDPKGQWPVAITSQLVPFQDAIMDATEEKP